ncbi:hypothetical protein EYF80_033051 [Liparis tanakae]|uniref:Uncharacterized protein n=1 Tax=Liparis tanakae TaxID=230148 RepID=A0A4Z2GT70_9TELE|nr:hypothetical protein EYF80_033051 [Liparis tanakae]
MHLMLRRDVGFCSIDKDKGPELTPKHRTFPFVLGRVPAAAGASGRQLLERSGAPSEDADPQCRWAAAGKVAPQSAFEENNNISD